MGFFGKIGDDFKKVGHDISHDAHKAGRDISHEAHKVDRKFHNVDQEMQRDMHKFEIYATVDEKHFLNDVDKAAQEVGPYFQIAEKDIEWAAGEIWKGI